MAKTSKQSKEAKPVNKSKRFYRIHPWQCRHHINHSEIVAYVEASGKWETVLTVHQTSGINTETMATFILNLVNDNQNNRDLLFEAMLTLETVLEKGRLDYGSELDANSIVGRIKKKIV